MIYVLIAVFVAGLTLGGAGVNAWKDGQIARHEQAQAQADAKIKAAADAARQEAQNKIVDMEAAYIAGESNAKTITKTVYLRGQQNVAAYEVFRNPACVLPPLVLSELNRQRAGLLPAADTGVPATAVPVAGAPSGRPDVNAVPANAQGHGNDGRVSAPPASPSGGSQVPGQNVRPVPKPKPVA